MTKTHKSSYPTVFQLPTRDKYGEFQRSPCRACNTVARNNLLITLVVQGPPFAWVLVPSLRTVTVGNLTRIPSPRAVTAGLVHGLTLSSRVSSGDASSHSSSCACGGRVYVVVIALQLRVCTAVGCLVITLAEGATHTKGRERNV